MANWISNTVNGHGYRGYFTTSRKGEKGKEGKRKGGSGNKGVGSSRVAKGGKEVVKVFM